MNRAREFPGKCSECGAQYVGSQMEKHLASCVAEKDGPQRKTPGKNGGVFGLKVDGPGYAGTYWLFLEAPAGLTLLDLDRFLREIWLECCGHCSAFTIGNVRYEPSKPPPELLEWGPSPPTRLMKVSLGEVLRPGLAFRYEYDFGTTTELGLKVLWEREASRERISILARNEAPALTCASCKAAAEWVCTDCIQEYEKNACYCSRCVGRHGCDEDMSLPVVNSPRMGACGYTGPRKETRWQKTWAPAPSVVKVLRKRR